MMGTGDDLCFTGREAGGDGRRSKESCISAVGPDSVD